MSPAVSNTDCSHPTELLFDIAEFLFEPCTLRRHIAEKLLEQYFTLTSSAHDQQIRNLAYAMMDLQERQTYLAIRQEFANIYLANTTMRCIALKAERGWLRAAPMDIRTFRDFCDNPSARRYVDRDYIVIEMFSQQDFIHPPVLLLNKVLSTANHLTTQELSQLSRRMHLPPPLSQPFVALHQVDKRICEALSTSWVHELVKLPKHVKGVKVLYKRPFPPSGMVLGPSMMLPPKVKCDVYGVLRGVEGELRRGRDVFEGILTE